jgi:U3 small nucleolar RNA-associated protein 14
MAERTEASLKVSEFSVSPELSRAKLILSDLLGPAKTSSSVVALKKLLNRVKPKKLWNYPLTQKRLNRSTEKKH